MRPGVVVGVCPGVDSLPGGGQVLERGDVVEQFGAQRLVEPLDLTGGGRRVRLGVPGGDPVLPAHPLQEHLYQLRAGVL
jgi:hypothetical protein